MKPEELIIKTKGELLKEEQKATEEVIKNVYKELEKRIKNDGYESVDIGNCIEVYSYKIQSKILDNVIKRLKENGYYVANSNVYLNYDSYKKERKFDKMLFLALFIFAAMIFLLNINWLWPVIYNVCNR